jgi:hypothetical protein
MTSQDLSQRRTLFKMLAGWRKRHDWMSSQQNMEQLLDRHGQQHSDEYWEELAEELNQRRRRRK